MVIEEDIAGTASDYEQTLLTRLARAYKTETQPGIEVEQVRLEGSYPDTRLVVVFRSAARNPMEAASSRRFGYRTRVWPAEDDDPEAEAGHKDVLFLEFLGTDWCQTQKRAGPDGIVWLS